MEIRKWNEMGLHPLLVEALESHGLTAPTPVQERTIPLLLQKKPVEIESRTGTGKTLAYGLPLLQAIDRSRRVVQALVLTPTRELAMQVADVLNAVSERLAISTATLVGGRSFEAQARRVQQGAQVIIGTPGRVQDHLRQASLDLSDCVMLVLDEVDEMLDQGYQEDLTAILASLPSVQAALASATWPEAVRHLADRVAPGAERVVVEEQAGPIEHRFIETYPNRKAEAIARVIRVQRPLQALVFCAERDETHALAGQLRRFGVGATALHGGLNQQQRVEIMDRFRRRDIRVLVATDLAARGLDVPGIDLVVNASIPLTKEAYVHRAGRTGRAGRRGQVVSLITRADRAAFQPLREAFGIAPLKGRIEDKAPTRAAAKPAKRQEQKRRR